MTPQESVDKLEAIREQILNNLTGMTDQLVDDNNLGFDALVAIARATGKVDMLEKALKKCEAIEDPLDKTNALLELLNEVEVRLAVDTSEVEPETAPEEEKEEEILNTETNTETQE